MSPERESEYSELLAYVSFFATAVWKISPATDTHPAQTITKIISEFGKSKALVGLRQAANDTIEETSNWSSESRTNLDETLKGAGIITLSEIARRYASVYKRILKRGKIKNETEYYLVNGILVDQGSEISDEERTRLQELIDAYEVSKTT
ncbi:MAG: hypothetical protein JWP34_3750 [Massilia sp.]|jgi:hypothetical protein|nr:hypothetical protein [Massilia sp.]MDB5909636.1 hypothetical protein [Massilia sp.]